MIYGWKTGGRTYGSGSRCWRVMLRGKRSAGHSISMRPKIPVCSAMLTGTINTRIKRRRALRALFSFAFAITSSWTFLRKLQSSNPYLRAFWRLFSAGQQQCLWPILSSVEESFDFTSLKVMIGGMKNWRKISDADIIEMVLTKDFLSVCWRTTIQPHPFLCQGAEIAQLAFFPRSGDKTLSKVW